MKLFGKIILKPLNTKIELVYFLKSIVEIPIL